MSEMSPAGNEVESGLQEAPSRPDNQGPMQVAIVAHHRTSTNLALTQARPGMRILEPATRRPHARRGRRCHRPPRCRRGPGRDRDRPLGAGATRGRRRPRPEQAPHARCRARQARDEPGPCGTPACPHPRTAHVTSPSDSIPFEPPVVVKPRFGSWGLDVVLCQDAAALRRHLVAIADRPWFASHGALVQELVPAAGPRRPACRRGRLRGGRDQARCCTPGEWRTNVALGAVREPVEPSSEACELAIRAAAAVEGDLVGVDLLPGADGEFVVIEINGAPIRRVQPLPRVRPPPLARRRRLLAGRSRRSCPISPTAAVAPIIGSAPRDLEDLLPCAKTEQSVIAYLGDEDRLRGIFATSPGAESPPRGVHQSVTAASPCWHPAAERATITIGAWRKS